MTSVKLGVHLPVAGKDRIRYESAKRSDVMHRPQKMAQSLRNVKRR